VTISDQKRMAKACRTYGALLRAYPASFRRDYDDILVQHFRDEYRHALASGKRFPLLHFWVFILFDFLRSLLMEVQEEVVKMIKKNFFVYSAIAAGMASLLWLFLIDAPYTLKPYFLAESGWFLFFALGSLALFGILNATRSHLLFQILPVLMLGSSFVFLPIPRQHSFLGTWGLLGSYLGMEEAKVIDIVLVSYLILIALTGILMLVKRKWLPGVVLVMMGIVPMGLTALVNWLYTIIPSFGETEDEWLLIFSVLLFSAAWFVIAWWLKKEREEISQPGRLEAA
jgi:hypothetical protein